MTKGGGGGGGGGRTESDRKGLCQLFGPQTYLQWVQRPLVRGFNCHFQRKLYFLFQKGFQHFPGVGVELNCLFPKELVIFKVSPGHMPPPPSSLGLCMTDSSQNDRVSCLNHELFSLYCTDFPVAKITYSIAKTRIFMIVKTGNVLI